MCPAYATVNIQNGKLSMIVLIFLFSLLNSHMNRIAGLFSDLFPNIFKNPYDITHRAIGVFYAHIDHAAIVWYAVESGMDFHSAFAELCTNVIRERHVCAAAAYVGRLNYSAVFIYFFVHIGLLHSVHNDGK